MSAIDNTFHFVRNPTEINGFVTTYVSKRGSDVSGDGTAQNPYASIAKATSVATEGTNIMLDDGVWSQQRTLNNRVFIWFGNAKTRIDASVVQMSMYNYDKFYNIEFFSFTTVTSIELVDCILIGFSNSNSTTVCFDRCIVINSSISSRPGMNGINNSVLINSTRAGWEKVGGGSTFYNNIVIGIDCLPTAEYVNYNNYTTLSIPTGNGVNSHSINNATTGQTLADYFNYVHPNVLANPTTEIIDDWLKCDFTAKEGSKNIGAGEKGTTIGLNQGHTMYADNSANDMFKESNGATLKNIAWDSILNGYVLVQKERVCAGATASTITLDSSASSVDDYYNNLFVGIVGGDGYGELFLITDYDGATKTATIDGTWNTTPNTSSIYTISGTIFSATKDFGKAIKVKRNWTFADNFTTLADGRFAEFMTNLTSQGKELPVNCFLYEYSVDGTNWVQGHTADDLVSATNGENKVTDAIYGDCSQNYDEASAKGLVMRYIRINVHIGFNI